MNGMNQSVDISTNPSNAEIWIDGNFIGRSPIVTKLERKSSHLLKVQLEGYAPHHTTFKQELSGWVFGNLLFGGLPGLAIDAATGSLYRLTPEQPQIDLHKEPDAAPIAKQLIQPTAAEERS